MPNFPVSFLLKCYCILSRLYFLCELRTWKYSSVRHTVAAHPLSAMWYALCAASAHGQMFPFPIYFPQKIHHWAAFAVGWPVHTWTLPLILLPQCCSRTIISLWQWQSQSLWSVPGIQNKRAMPALKGGSAAAAKSECGDGSEDSKLFGPQNLQL